MKSLRWSREKERVVRADERSDTPRTDSFMLQRAWSTPDKQFPDVQELIELARQLERELAEALSSQPHNLSQENYDDLVRDAMSWRTRRPSDGRDKPAAYIFHTGLFWPDGLTKEQKFVAAPLYHAPAFRPSKQSSAAPDQMPEEILFTNRARNFSLR